AGFGNNVHEALLAPDPTSFLTQWSLTGVFWLPIILALGAASGRFLVRALPTTMRDQRRRGRFGATVLYAGFIGFIAFYFVMGLVFMGGGPPRERPEGLDTLAAVVSVVMGLPLWASGAIGLLIHSRRRSRTFLERPFVLFLRRFSTFSDRAVIA